MTDIERAALTMMQRHQSDIAELRQRCAELGRERDALSQALDAQQGLDLFTLSERAEKAERERDELRLWCDQTITDRERALKHDLGMAEARLAQVRPAALEEAAQHLEAAAEHGETTLVVAVLRTQAAGIRALASDADTGGGDE